MLKVPGWLEYPPGLGKEQTEEGAKTENGTLSLSFLSFAFNVLKVSDSAWVEPLM